MHYYEDTNKWKIFDLDVWGNQEDGYDINDFVEVAQVTFTDKELELDANIINKLVDMELLKPEAVDKVYVDSDYACIMIYEEETDKPLYCLEMIRIYHRIGGYDYE